MYLCSHCGIGWRLVLLEKRRRWLRSSRWLIGPTLRPSAVAVEGSGDCGRCAQSAANEEHALLLLKELRADHELLRLELMTTKIKWV